MKVLGLLIVRQPDGSSSHFDDHRMIFILVGVGKCPAFFGAVLMTIHTADRVRLAVEEKALFLSDSYRADAQRLSYLIDYLSIAQHANRGGVKIRIVVSIPKMGISDRESL